MTLDPTSKFISHHTWGDTLPKRIARISKGYANRKKNIPGGAQARQSPQAAINLP